MSKASEIAKLESVIRSQGGYQVPGVGWEFAKYSSPKYTEGVADGEKSGRAEGSIAERHRVAELLMDVLGLRERYPDVTRTEEGVRTRYATTFGYYSHAYPTTESYTYEVTDYGYVKFLADVEAVQTHADVEAARKRLFGKK